MGGINVAVKTTITLETKHRAAYDAMHAEVPGLTLSDFVRDAITFYLAYKDEASLRPLVKHLGLITERLKHVAAPPLPINQHHLADLVAKVVIDQFIALQPPPPPEVTGWRGWLIRWWQRRDITHAPSRPVIPTIRQSRP
jgi:hypothetical protein